jgi:hypothetical protein
MRIPIPTPFAPFAHLTPNLTTAPPGTCRLDKRQASGRQAAGIIGRRLWMDGWIYLDAKHGYHHDCHDDVVPVPTHQAV